MIVVNYGKNWAQVTYDALAASDIDKYLSLDHNVAIKPNLILARPAKDGATTHPEVVEGIIRYLQDYGVSSIKIIESAWVGDSTKRAFKICGYEDLSKRFNISLTDLKDDRSIALRADGLDIEVCQEALHTDFLINVPVLKAHCQTLMTCALKNLKGCIPDREKRRFHSLGLHKPIAALNTLLRTGYVVVDGICGDLSFEEGGNPVEANRVIVGRNPLTVDSFCAGLIGYSPDEVGYMPHAKRLGVGDYFSSQTPLVELNADQKPLHSPTANRAADKYRRYIEEDSACSACYAALVFALHRSGKPPNGKIYIGQGFRSKANNQAGSLGIGNCASGFANFVPGCPPEALEISKKLP